MLKVVVDARSVVAKRSGIGNYVEALLRHMVPLATDIEWLLLRHPGARAPIVDHPRVRELHFSGETKSMATVFALGARHSFAGYDLYHSPADLVPLGLACPYVVTIHDLMWIEAPQLASAFLPVRLANGLWYSTNLKRAVRGARALVAISQATVAAMARVFPGSEQKTTVIHHGLEPARFAREHAKDRAFLDAIVPPECSYSLIVGQGSPYKNHDGMLRAFVAATADRPDQKLVLVRRFARVDREMQQLLARPEVAAKVIRLEHVSDDVLLALYRHAQVLLFVSHYEGFGLPALEAMALGVPVLTSTAEAIVEVTGDAALHVHSRDHAAIVAAIRKLLADHELRAELSRRGPERARAFTWDRCARATLDVYRTAISAKP